MANNGETPFSKNAVVGWALLISTVLNLFLVGVMGGSLHHHDPHHNFGLSALGAVHGDMLDGWVERHLNQQDAAAFRDVFQAHLTDLKVAHQHLSQANVDLANAFKKEPNDESLQHAFDEIAEARNETQSVVNSIIQDCYKKLSPEGRSRLADLDH